jgi:hypothetical protein
VIIIYLKILAYYSFLQNPATALPYINARRAKDNARRDAWVRI